MKLKPYEKALKPYLEALGFTPKDSIWTIDLAPNVMGGLGLNEGSQYRGEILVNPIVGVRFQNLERIVAECHGRKFHPTNPATVFEPLGYLTPEKRFKQWLFTPDTLEAVAKDMAAAFETYGLPFIRFSTNFMDYRRARKGTCLYFAETEPVGALLEGDVEQARIFLDKALGKLGARTDAGADMYKKFAAAFSERYLSGKS